MVIFRNTLKLMIFFTFLVLSTGAISPAMAAANHNINVAAPQPYFHEWCRDVRHLLLAAIQSANHAPTDADEVAILGQALDRALQVGPSRFKKFFEFTLKTAKADVAIYNGDATRQGQLLRRAFHEALEDLDYLDGSHSSDNASYILTLLQRAQNEGYRSPTNDGELLFLQRGIQRALALLNDRDYRRSPSYACAARVLSDALIDSKNPSLQMKTRIMILRIAVSHVVESGLGCR
jgi:hypothetical protein